MFKKIILGLTLFFCTASGITFAHINNNENEAPKEWKCCVDPEKLFFETGKLYYESDYNGIIPLTSITYSNGLCYTFISDQIREIYMQGYQCNGCHYVLIKHSPGAPGSCPSCGRNDWTIL